MIQQKHRLLVILIVLTLIILQYPLFGLNLTVSGQNEARWGRGEPVDDSSDDSYAYFENYLDLNVHMNNFRFYLRQSYLLPSVPELGGIRQSGWDAFDKWHIGYESDGISLRGGDFYRTYGRGLLFGTVEFIDLGFDTGLEGVLVEGYTQLPGIVLRGAMFRGVESDTSGNFNEAAEGVWLSCQVDRW
ncbi:MAG: DUF6029 family protein, partial [Candidatus Electryoneaceae bacterium]|nr:DUF6029 family protein [Candidatus Electryoneaceae bacterium]